VLTAESGRGLRVELGTESGRGLRVEFGTESGRGLRGALTTRVCEDEGVCCGASCGPGDIEAFDGPGLGRESAGDGEGSILGAGEFRAEGVLVLADLGLGGVRRIDSNLDPLTLSLIILRGRGPSEVVTLEALSGG